MTLNRDTYNRALTVSAVFYAIHSGFKWLLYVPFLLMQQLLPRLFSCVQRHGITIVSFYDGQSSHDYVQCVLDAVQILSTHDIDRFRHIRREVQMILIAPMPVPAVYARPGRLCVIDPKKLQHLELRDSVFKLLACALVHEATHGRFHSKKIAYCGPNRQRIEYACVCEEARSAKHLAFSKAEYDLLLDGILRPTRS